MTQKKLILLALFVAVAGTLSAGGSAFARGAEDDDRSEVRTVSVESETETEQEGDDSTAELSESQKQKVEARKEEIKKRVEAVKAQRERLSENRLKTCEKRQERINSIFEKATEQNKKQFEVIRKIEEKVEAFYQEKKLTSEGYDTAVENANLAELNALAAIETSKDLTFDCATVGSTNPGEAIKTAMQARHESLKEYRTAVKELILVVKKHNGQNRSTTEDTTTDTTTETENDSTTGGQQ